MPGGIYAGIRLIYIMGSERLLLCNKTDAAGAVVGDGDTVAHQNGPAE